MKSAERLYKQKSKGYKQGYLLSTVDFKLLENLCNKWEIEHYGKHINRFPDSTYFLTNPYTDGFTDYILMNKNTKVALLKIENKSLTVLNIKEIFCEQYAPLECFKDYKLDCDAITSWFKGRGIPSWRDGLDDLLDNLGIENKDYLLNKAFGLSLSDQYWLNPIEMHMDWNDINFFEHNFNSKDYVDANFEHKVLDPRQIDFFSPSNTSDGILRKAWIVDKDNKRYMLKGSYKHAGLEPFNEVLASMIAEAIGLNHVQYSLQTIGNTILSKCECFIDKDTELISAYAILKFNNINLIENNNVYESYINILKDHGIKNVETELWKMFILDYIILNRDRHLGNFGVIRDVNTLTWLKIAPNFDSGQSMYSQADLYKMNFNNDEGTFFNRKNIDFETIFNEILPFSQLDKIAFSELYIIAEKWKSLLNEYRYITNMEELKIDYLFSGLIKRIRKLENKL